jgi:hypothetical protein
VYVDNFDCSSDCAADTCTVDVLVAVVVPSSRSSHWEVPNVDAYNTADNIVDCFGSPIAVVVVVGKHVGVHTGLRLDVADLAGNLCQDTSRDTACCFVDCLGSFDFPFCLFI